MDSFARAALWESGLDYLHGTGHGVGCFLNVHEGPCGISYKTFDDEPLEAGMIVSDGMAGSVFDLGAVSCLLIHTVEFSSSSCWEPPQRLKVPSHKDILASSVFD